MMGQSFSGIRFLHGLQDIRGHILIHKAPEICYNASRKRRDGRNGYGGRKRHGDYQPAY